MLFYGSKAQQEVAKLSQERRDKKTSRNATNWTPKKGDE